MYNTKNVQRTQGVVIRIEADAFISDDHPVRRPVEGRGFEANLLMNRVGAEKGEAGTGIGAGFDERLSRPGDSDVLLSHHRRACQGPDIRPCRPDRRRLR